MAYEKRGDRKSESAKAGDFTMEFGFLHGRVRRGGAIAAQVVRPAQVNLKVAQAHAVFHRRARFLR